MKRGMALVIDLVLYYLFAFSIIFLVICVNPQYMQAYFGVTITAAVLIWLVYLFISDYFFAGMTLGKRILGVPMQWAQSEEHRLSESVIHTGMKCFLISCWPLGLILYLVSKEMPYDKRLGILYLPDESKASGKKTAWKFAVLMVGAVMLFYGSIFLTLQTQARAAFYQLKDQKITSLSGAVGSEMGKQSLRSYSSSFKNGAMELEYSYRVSTDGSEVANAYMEYLVKEDHFRRNQEEEAPFNSNAIVLTKSLENSQKELQVILIPGSRWLLVWIYYK